MLQKLYKYIFWFGYISVLITSLIPIPGSMDKVQLGYGIFNIRLDHLLHLSVYFLISMYYMAGQWKGLTLFNNNALRKFIVVTVILASITEVVQLWVPARAFNPLDWLSNVSGIIIGLVVIMIQAGRKREMRGTE